MSDEKKYVYWNTEMKQLHDLAGWEVCIKKDIAYYSRGIHENASLKISDRYRKLMTEEEARVFFALQACSVECPKGHRIVDFRMPKSGDKVISVNFATEYVAYTMSCDSKLPSFIIEKIEPEINWVVPTDQDAVELKRPAVRFRANESHEWRYDGLLISVNYSATPYIVRIPNGQDLYFYFCEMDASLREQGDK